MSPWAAIATLKRLKRPDGRFVAEAAAGLPFLLSEGMEVWLVPPRTDSPRTLTVAKVADRRGASAVVAFEEPLEPDQAQALVGCQCIVERSVVQQALDAASPVSPGLDAGIVGWTVADAEGRPIGPITDVAVHPTQLTATVQTADGPRLVPVADDLIAAIDEGGCTLVLHLPAGLLEL